MTEPSHLPAPPDNPAGELLIDVPDPFQAGAAAALALENLANVAAMEQLAGQTSARIAVGRAGPRYRTATLLRFQADHAVTQDAMGRDVSGTLLEEWGLFTVQSAVTGGTREYLMAPHLGRRLSDAGRRLVQERCPAGRDIQVVVGDGLSAEAVEANAGVLLPALAELAAAAGLTTGAPFFVRHARVGVLNDIGDLLAPRVMILLIGERPGLGRADALSAYLAYRPRTGHTDADRDVISGISPRAGMPTHEAAARIIDLARTMIARQASGVRLRMALEQKGMEDSWGN